MEPEIAKTITSGANAIMRTARLEYDVLSKAKNVIQGDILGVEIPKEKEIEYGH